MALHITEKQVGPATVIVLTGRIAFGEENTQLQNKLQTLLAGKPCLILDMARVDSIDSAGWGTLMASFNCAANQGVRIALANLTKRLRVHLGITKLVDLFETFDSLDDAVKSFEEVDSRQQTGQRGRAKGELGKVG